MICVGSYVVYIFDLEVGTFLIQQKSIKRHFASSIRRELSNACAHFMNDFLKQQSPRFQQSGITKLTNCKITHVFIAAK